jgi:hypothetical protein
MAKKWQLKLGAVLLSLSLAGGCVETVLLSVGAVGAIGAYKWVEGAMEKSYPKPYAQTMKATLDTCRKLGLRVSGSPSETGTKADIEATDRNGTKAKISVVAKPNNITDVKIRFGMFGDQSASAVFHAQLMKELGISPNQ